MTLRCKHKNFERRPYAEGDDVIVEICIDCGKVRYEVETDRPMAWFIDPSNPTGYRYAYDPHGNGEDLNKPNPWRYPNV